MDSLDGSGPGARGARLGQQLFRTPHGGGCQQAWCRVAFCGPRTIKFSIVDEGQETGNTQNLEITAGLLRYHSGQRPVLF